MKSLYIKTLRESQGSHTWLSAWHKSFKWLLWSSGTCIQSRRMCYTNNGFLPSHGRTGSTSFFVGDVLLLDFYLLFNDGEVFSNILLDLAYNYILIIWKEPKADLALRRGELNKHWAEAFLPFFWKQMFESSFDTKITMEN